MELEKLWGKDSKWGKVDIATQLNEIPIFYQLISIYGMVYVRGVGIRLQLSSLQMAQQSRKSKTCADYIAASHGESEMCKVTMLASVCNAG